MEPESLAYRPSNVAGVCALQHGQSANGLVNVSSYQCVLVFSSTALHCIQSRCNPGWVSHSLVEDIPKTETFVFSSVCNGTPVVVSSPTTSVAHRTGGAPTNSLNDSERHFTIIRIESLRNTQPRN